MTEYIQLIALSLAGGIVSLAGGVLLLSKHKLADTLAQYATPFAAGALLAAVFLDLLKDGLEEASANTVLTAALAGILLFFVAERFLHWFHHHHQHEHDDAGDAVTKPLIIVGDTIHNALDGVAIAAAFLISPATGVITTIAVAAHEIPQEIGDFGLLLSKGMSRKRVLLVNIMSALATTIFAVITYALGDADVLPIGLLLGLSAGFLLYIAMSDIIPEIHDKAPKNKLLDWRPLLLIAGVLVVGVSVNIAHKYIDAGHDHEESHSIESDHSTKSAKTSAFSVDQLPAGWRLSNNEAGALNLQNLNNRCFVDATYTTDTAESNSPNIDQLGQTIEAIEGKGYTVEKLTKQTLEYNTSDGGRQIVSQTLKVSGFDDLFYQQYAYIPTEDAYTAFALSCPREADLTGAQQALQAATLNF